MDGVWSDVVVSDGALTQAVRTIRRALADDRREPAFIRTVSRHGYQFIHAGVVEEADEGTGGAVARDLPTPAPPAASPPSAVAPDPMDAALDRSSPPPRLVGTTRRRRRARRRSATLPRDRGGAPAARSPARACRGPGAATGRAMGCPGIRDGPLRRTAWSVPRALTLVDLRLRRALRVRERRWAARPPAGALAGLAGGLVGGLVLSLAPGSPARASVAVALALVGALVGGLGAAGVGAGLAIAEALARSFRGAALIALGALGGGLVGSLAHLVGRWTLEGLFGGDLSAVGGGVEGMGLGAAAGLGTPWPLLARKAGWPRPAAAGASPPRSWRGSAARRWPCC